MFLVWCVLHPVYIPSQDVLGMVCFAQVSLHIYTPTEGSSGVLCTIPGCSWDCVCCIATVAIPSRDVLGMPCLSQDIHCIL